MIPKMVEALEVKNVVIEVDHDVIWVPSACVIESRGASPSAANAPKEATEARPRRTFFIAVHPFFVLVVMPSNQALLDYSEISFIALVIVQTT